LHGTGGVRQIFPDSKLKLIPSRIVEDYVKGELFRSVNPACRDCSQSVVDMERMFTSEELVVSAHCKGQLETVEILPPPIASTLADSMLSADASRATMTHKVFKACPDEIKLRGKSFDRAWVDEMDHMSDAARYFTEAARRLIGGEPEPEPEPKAPKYAEFGDW